jgi:DNA ligase-1
MKFQALTDYFNRLEKTSKRLEMFDILAELFSEAGAEDISEIIYMVQGQLKPPFYGIEIGMSEKLLIRTLSDAADVPTESVLSIFRETGDMGLTAEALIKRKGGLRIKDVYSDLMMIAQISGKGSVDKKIELLVNLLRGVSPREARYITRFVQGRLRLGIGDPTVLEALALAEGGRELRADLERAYNLCSDLGLVAKTLKSSGIEDIRAFKVHVGYPIRMALCERLPSAEDIIKKIGRAAVEAKYDGFRCQVHKNGKKIEIFSRNLERMTHMFPEITNATLQLPAKEVIIEGEALATNEDTGELLPFQVTIQRKRKHGIDALSKEFPLRFFAFELLYLDGVDYTRKPYIERRSTVVNLVRDNPVIEPAVMFETEDPIEIHAHFEEFVETGLEGIVAKRLDSHYTAGARNFNWIKLKRSYKGELADTVDVCIIGYYLGKGSRARFGIGALLGAVYDPETDTFKTVSKIGTGFTEDELAQLKETLNAVALKHKPPRVDSDLEPDVWVEPRYVLTVTADEITRSPMHTAGRDRDGAGYALRFPRAVGQLRVDKNPEDANTVGEVIQLEKQQKKVKVK